MILNVRTNMSDKNKKQLVIIGAGPGGYAAAFHAADLGLKVTLVDPEVNPGGVCLYRGCIPSKALLHLAKIKQEAMQAEDWGIAFEPPSVDAAKIFKWKDETVKQLTGGLGQLSKARKIEYIKGRARFKSDTTLEIENVDGEDSTVTFENVIIATGSGPSTIPNIEYDYKFIIDSTDALDLKEIPEKMLVIGGGYIGLELGSAFASFGSKVSIAEMTESFLPGADRDLVKIFEKESKQLFEEVYFKTSVEKATVKDKKVTVILKGEKESQKKKYDKVLVAVGRKPNTDSFNIEKAGIEMDDKGFIKVDDKRATNVKNIYAIGDVTGEPMLAHKASHEGRIAAEVIAGHPGAAYAPKVIPGIVFTNPEIAWCGLTETDAKDKKVKVLKFPWGASGRAKAIGTANGLTKLIVHPESGIVLGGGVAGKGAGSLIPEIALAVEMGATTEDLALTIHPHPTLSETIMESAESFLGGATHYLGK
ncbi:dihydrolipoyl dehydrogenase [Marivirga lumbricoides]|uniref:Dihydrolipoyl dehydrogenase n=2 Tax=Marivirga lumbricoides TaxID=1046115 RepID=A0ABQ1MDK2_9BACT|nr:dihydrolipoyl dehydrogenase [Marivirga lumbricoides]